MGKASRDKAAERAVKARINRTHIKSFKILGSQKNQPDESTVYILRTVGSDNYLFKINTLANPDGSYFMSGFIPVNDKDEFGEYRVYNPGHAGEEALKPTALEKKKFKGYKK